MKLLIIIMIGCLTTLAGGQTIVAAEYFIDDDPGQGNGTPILVTGNSETFNVRVAPSLIAALDPGFHRLATRVQNSSGEWSVSRFRYFEKRPPGDGPSEDPRAMQVTQGEYFINEDPGLGNGTSFSITGNPAEANVTVDPALIAALEPGFHRLGVRVRNDQGEWAIASTRFFEKRAVDTTTAGENLTLAAIEYRWYQNNEPVTDAIMLAVDAGQTSASFEQLASLAGLSEGGEYQLVFTPIDSAGQRGFSATRNVSVQTTDGNGNGLPDLWEQTFGVTNPAADADGDLVSNLEEFQNGTNPNLADSDGDGVNDRAEIDLKAAGLAFDPVVANSALATALQENANASGLYSLNQLQVFAGGAPVLERSGAGPLTLKFAIETSQDLRSFQKVALPAGSLTISPDDEIEYQITPDAAVKFYTLRTR